MEQLLVLSQIQFILTLIIRQRGHCVAFKYVTYFRLQCLKRDNVRTHVENYGINQSVPKICLLT